MLQMLLSAWLILCCAATALASPHQRAAGLTISVKGPPKSVPSIDDLKFTAEVTNTGSAAVRVLKYGTILDGDLPTMSFIVTRAGVEVPFMGVKPMISLNNLDDSAIVNIGAGQTISVVHSVASLYDFASVGVGQFTFEPVTSFQLVNDANHTQDSPFLQTGSTHAITVEVTTDVAARPPSGEDRGAVDICRDPARRAFIDASYVEAKRLAITAFNYIRARGASDRLYRAYWGHNNPNTVLGVFYRVAAENSSTRILQCGDPLNLCVKNNWVAYTHFPSTNIYYCEIFYRQVTTRRLCTDTPVNYRNIRGGTTLHELTHATSRTVDVVYGCPQDQALPDRSKIRNADSYNCFATQVWSNLNCHY